MSLLARRYATALHQLAKQQGVVEPLAADLAALHGDLAYPSTRAYLLSPDLQAAERAAALDKLLADKHALLHNLVGVLQQRHRLPVLFDLAPQFQLLLQAERGEISGQVESPFPVDDQQLAALAALAGQLTGKQVQLRLVLRPELLGGVRLRLGNVLYDGSTLASLQQLEGRLLQASI